MEYVAGILLGLGIGVGVAASHQWTQENKTIGKLVWACIILGFIIGGLTVT